MKINIERDTVTLTSTNNFEFAFLVDAYKDFVAPSVEPTFIPPPKRVHKKHKRHIFAKDCVLCGKKVKGAAAMGMHMRMHRRKGERIIPVVSE